MEIFSRLNKKKIDHNKDLRYQAPCLKAKLKYLVNNDHSGCRYFLFKKLKYYITIADPVL